MLRRATSLSALGLCLILGAAGCDDAPATTPTPDTALPETVEDTAVATDESSAPDETAQPDEGTPDQGPETTVPPKLEYPEGPYGYNVGDTAPDMTLYDPFAGKWISFSDYYRRYDKRVLFISSAAGWCGPCQAEAVELGDKYIQFADDGLEPLYALFEDKQGVATTIGSTATANFIADWKTTYDVQYPLLIDPPRVDGDPNSFALAPFWESDGIPFAFMVTTHDMQVRWKVHGYSPLNINAQILTQLQIAREWWDEYLANRQQ